MRVPIRKGTKLSDEDVGAYYLTPEAAARLESSLAELERQVPALAAEKSRAAALGDRSENAEYQDAKAKLSRVHSRILSTRERLKRAVIIAPTAGDGIVEIGSSVTIEKTGDTTSRKTYRIVGALETNPAAGRISHRSPLGSALLGKCVGEAVSIKTDRGETLYSIVEVK